jgi:hypothetical protein
MQLISYQQPVALSSLALDVHAAKQRHSACSEPDRKDACEENRERNQTPLVYPGQ